MHTLSVKSVCCGYMHLYSRACRGLLQDRVALLQLAGADRGSALIDELQRPVLVVGPTQLHAWLVEISRIDATLRGRWIFADAEHFAVMPVAMGAAEQPQPARATEDDDAIAHQPAASKRPRLEPGADAPHAAASLPPEGQRLTRLWRLRPPYERASFYVPWPTQSPLCSGGPLGERDAVAGPDDVDAAMACLGVVSLSVTRVRHCAKAYGLRLGVVSRGDPPSPEDPASAPLGQAAPAPPAASPGGPLGWSFVYSGDTRPCHELEQVSAASGGAARAPYTHTNLLLPRAPPPPACSWAWGLPPCPRPSPSCAAWPPKGSAAAAQAGCPLPLLLPGGRGRSARPGLAAARCSHGPPDGGPQIRLRWRPAPRPARCWCTRRPSRTTRAGRGRPSAAGTPLRRRRRGSRAACGRATPS